MRLCISSCAPPALPYKHWHFGAAENRTARWARRQQSWWCDVSRTPSPLTIADVRDPELANPSSSTAEAEHSARKQVIVTAERTRAWDGRRYIDTYTPPPRGMRARWRGREREREIWRQVGVASDRVRERKKLLFTTIDFRDLRRCQPAASASLLSSRTTLHWHSSNLSFFTP